MPRGQYAYAKIMYMSKEKVTTNILRELEPTVESELNRHVRQADTWNPHDYVPWGDGENFAYLGGRDWELTQSKLGEVARTAMYINLLTEDNLPSYHREIATTFGRDSAWGEWVGRWTAEEARHGISMRDYLVVTRAIDPVALEQARMQHMTAGYDSGDKTPLEAIAYVTLQELATRIAHRNTGKESLKDGDELADKLLGRIAKDENLHMVFYRNLGRAALDVAPDDTMRAITKEVQGFALPGATIPGFRKHAVTIAKAGIYDLDQHVHEVIEPTLKFWKIDTREDLTGDGAKARDDLYLTIEALATAAKRFKERQAEAASRQRDNQ